MPLSALEKLRQRTGAVRIQSCVRQRQHYLYAVTIACKTWEKLIDHKQGAYFYFNHTTKAAQWFKPHLLTGQTLDINKDFNYYESEEYKNQRCKVHVIEAVDPNEFIFNRPCDTEQPELDEAQYQVLDVPAHILQPPGEWTPVPTTKEDFGDTGLLTTTTGDSESWECPKCKFTNRPGMLTCDICSSLQPKKLGVKVNSIARKNSGSGIDKENTTTTPWSFPSVVVDDNVDQNDASDDVALALGEAQDLLRVLDREHADDDDSASDESDDSDDSSSSEDSFDGHFGIQDPPHIYVVFNPPLKPDDSHLVRLRNKNQRERFRNNQRAQREKEEIVMMSCEQALDSTSKSTVKRAIKMADALIGAVGIASLHSDLIRTFVAVRKWATELQLKRVDGPYPSNKPKDPNFHPVCWRKEKLVDTYLPLSSNASALEMKKRKKNLYDVLHHGRDGPFVEPLPVADVTAAVVEDDGVNKNEVEGEEGEEKSRDQEDVAATATTTTVTTVATAATTTIASATPSTPSASSMSGSLGGATEGEIQAANSVIFGSNVPGAKLGGILRINVHIGPGDHLGQRYSVTQSDAKLDQGYTQILSFMAWSFPYPGTIKYDVFTKTEPVWRSKITSDQVSKTRHKPMARKILSEAPVAADDKQLGWTHELTFYAFYGPVNASCRYFCSEMWNPYRNKLTLSNARGGWTPLFNLFAFPGRMYNIFCLRRPRAEPNEDEMIELYRVSPYNSLEDSIHVHQNGTTSTYKWMPQFSFYACESAFPGTVSLTGQERVGATGDVSMRISMSSYAHDSRVVDEQEKTTVEWNVVEQFFAWPLPVRGTIKIYCQVAKKPLRYRVTREFPIRPWKSLLSFFAPVHPRGWEVFENAKRALQKNTRRQLKEELIQEARGKPTLVVVDREAEELAMQEKYKNM